MGLKHLDLDLSDTTGLTIPVPPLMCDSKNNLKYSGSMFFYRFSRKPMPFRPNRISNLFNDDVYYFASAALKSNDMVLWLQR